MPLWGDNKSQFCCSVVSGQLFHGLGQPFVIQDNCEFMKGSYVLSLLSIHITSSSYPHERLMNAMAHLIYTVP